MRRGTGIQRQNCRYESVHGLNICSDAKYFRLSFLILSCFKLFIIIIFFVNLGLRVYDKNIRSTDATESAAFSHRTDVIDIYSNSWGPGDLGWQVQGPGLLGSKAIEHGIKTVSF